MAGAVRHRPASAAENLPSHGLGFIGRAIAVAILAVIGSLFTASTAIGQVTDEPPLAKAAIKAPEPVTPKPGELLISIKVETTCKRVYWDKPAEFAAPGNHREIDGGRELVIPAIAGRWRFKASVAPAVDVIESVEVIVEVKGPPPVPTPPSPNPGPTPTPPQPNPKPPDPPKPDPPLPVDPFAIELIAAYKLEVRVTKQQDAINLAALYRRAAKLAQDKTLTSCDEMLTAVREAARELVNGDSLTAVRRCVADELAKCSAPDALLTDVLRGKLAEVYARASAALELAAK